MLNKRLKEGIRKIHKPAPKARLSLGTLAVVSLCTLLLTVATFTQIKMSFNIPDLGIYSYLKFEYIPQIPVVLFIAALLGEFWGMFTILVYIILGLTPFYPVFALGGGLSYIFRYSFGYIFGFLFAVVVTSKRLRKSNSFWNIFFSVLAGVSVIHITGIIYMCIIAALRHDSTDFMLNMIYYQTFAKLIYDIVFGFIAVLTGKLCRKICWIIL